MGLNPDEAMTGDRSKGGTCFLVMLRPMGFPYGGAVRLVSAQDCAPVFGHPLRATEAENDLEATTHRYLASGLR